MNMMSLFVWFIMCLYRARDNWKKKMRGTIFSSFFLTHDFITSFWKTTTDVRYTHVKSQGPSPQPCYLMKTTQRREFSFFFFKNLKNYFVCKQLCKTDQLQCGKHWSNRSVQLNGVPPDTTLGVCVCVWMA